MALTFLQMQNEVAAYANRANASFVIGSVDILKRAINKARKWAESRHNFELSKVSVRIPSVSLTTGGALSTAVDNVDGTTPVNVKLVERAFLASPTGETFPVELVSRNYHVRRLQRRFENVMTTAEMTPARSTVLFQGFSIVQQGGTIYVTPPNSAQFAGLTTIPVYLDVVRWRPDYSADADTDFFLDHCVEFILYRSLYQLNLHLKEDQRIPISKDALADAWDTVIQWDTSLIDGMADDVTLD